MPVAPILDISILAGRFPGQGGLFSLGATEVPSSFRGCKWSVSDVERQPCLTVNS